MGLHARALILGSLATLALVPEASGQSLGGRKASGGAIASYMSGKQLFVGWHAPSTDPMPRDGHGRPMLALRLVNRGELLSIPALSDEGGFASSDLDRTAHLLRAMNGDEHPIDPRLLAVVYRVQTHFAAPEIRVVSGYRVPKPGSHSNHGRGRAMDLIVPGCADEEVARFVRGFGFVGVGVYPVSQFVHVDIRPRSYFWVDDSKPHHRNREHGILGQEATSSDAAALARGEPSVERFGIGTDVDLMFRSRGLLPGPVPSGGAEAVRVPGEDDEEDDH